MRTLHITIFERQDGPEEYDVAYNYDALPPFQVDGPYPSVDEAKASVPYTVTWQEPDADASRDAVAVAEVAAG